MVSKKAELIEKFREIRNNLDQESVRRYVDSMSRRIIKWIKNKGDKSG